MQLVQITKQENFANAREVRNMFEEIITNQARRLAAIENPTQEQIMTITAEDLLDSETENTEAPAEPVKEDKDSGLEETEEFEANGILDRDFDPEEEEI